VVGRGPGSPVAHPPLRKAPLPEQMDASEYFPWYQQQMLAGRIVAFSALEDLPAEARRDAEVYRHFGIKSNVTVPLAVGGKPPIGALGFNTTRGRLPRGKRILGKVVVTAIRLIAK
jgi:hypothetical protein